MKKQVLQNAERGGSALTSQPIVVPPTGATVSLRDSEFFRLPDPKARDPLSGLCRTSILEHGEAGDFKIVRVRKRGSQRGIVLVETASFLQWLHGLPSVGKLAKGEAR
jgi:hypothetical protein